MFTTWFRDGHTRTRIAAARTPRTRDRHTDRSCVVSPAALPCSPSLSTSLTDRTGMCCRRCQRTTSCTGTSGSTATLRTRPNNCHTPTRAQRVTHTGSVQARHLTSLTATGQLHNMHMRTGRGEAHTPQRTRTRHSSRWMGQHRINTEITRTQCTHFPTAPLHHCCIPAVPSS